MSYNQTKRLKCNLALYSLTEWQQTVDYKILIIIKLLSQNANASLHLTDSEECVEAVCFFRHRSQISEIAVVKILLMTSSITFKTGFAFSQFKIAPVTKSPLLSSQSPQCLSPSQIQQRTFHSFKGIPGKRYAIILIAEFSRYLSKS